MGKHVKFHQGQKLVAVIENAKVEVFFQRSIGAKAIVLIANSRETKELPLKELKMPAPARLGPVSEAIRNFR